MKTNLYLCNSKINNKLNNMKVLIKVGIDDSIFVELPFECIKECGTIEFNADNVEKWMKNEKVLKQFQFIKDETLATFVYDMPCELSFEEVKKLGRRELIQWALYECCIKVSDELADI